MISSLRTIRALPLISPSCLFFSIASDSHEPWRDHRDELGRKDVEVDTLDVWDVHVPRDA